LVFIEWTFGFERANVERIREEILDRVKTHTQTVGVIVCSRRRNSTVIGITTHSTGSLNRFAISEMPASGRGHSCCFKRQKWSSTRLRAIGMSVVWTRPAAEWRRTKRHAELKDKRRWADHVDRRPSPGAPTCILLLTTHGKPHLDAAVSFPAYLGKKRSATVHAARTLTTGPRPPLRLTFARPRL